MQLKIGDKAPDFAAQTTLGPIQFHDWIGNGWCILFSHPKDFTPVCTTELGYVAKLMPEFEKRGVKIAGLSIDTVSDHESWCDDISESQGARPTFPIIEDPRLEVAKLYGMLPQGTDGDARSRSAMDNATVRTVFVVGPDKKVRLTISYPMSTGRNFDEVLRVIDALQLTERHAVATPVNWKDGDDVIILPAISDEDARRKFPEGWRSPLPYMRMVPQPA